MPRHLLPSDQPYRRCPQCGALSFYLEPEGDRMTFLKVRDDGRFESREALPPGLPRDAHLYCAGCAWHGTAEQLLRTIC